jgi:hypothetical protein
MDPNFKSFADQLLLVKLAGERPDIMERPDIVNPFYKRVVKNALAFGAGATGGTGAALLLSDKMLPKILPMLSPKQRSLLAGGAALLSGAATGLTALTAARTLQQADKEEGEWRRKKKLWKGQK